MRYLFELNPWNQQRQFEKPVWVYPAHLAMYATHLKNEGHDVHWGKKRKFVNNLAEQQVRVVNDEQIDVPFTKLPYPDRKFTDALNPRWQSYGNYKFHPATHMMAANLCWYGKCTFCIDTDKIKRGEPVQTRSVIHCIEEVENCIHLGFKEIFDDSGTFPVGNWLQEFCYRMKVMKYNEKVTMGCNMKPVNIDYKMMADAGFRFLLFGLESANQFTLDKLCKGGKADKYIEIMKKASDAGLEPHGTFMTGYPWESEEDEKRTIELCHFLLKKGYLKTAQASVYSEPRTRPNADSLGHKYLPRFYDVYRSPTFLIRKMRDLKRWEDVTYLARGARLVVEEKWRKYWQKKSI